MPLIGNVLKPLVKSFLIPLSLMEAASATDAAIHKRMFGSDKTTLIISNEKINEIMKIVNSLEESGLWIKCVSEAVSNKAKEQKVGVLGMLLGTLGANLLANLLTHKVQLQRVNEQLGQMKTFSHTTSFNSFWNTIILSKWT